MTDKESRANEEALRFGRKRVRDAAVELAGSPEWQDADAIERVILRAQMLESCGEADQQEGEAGKRNGFLGDHPAERIADAILGRIGRDDAWRDPLPAEAGLPFARPGLETPGAIPGRLENPAAEMPPPRDWLADRLIPRGRVTLLTAEGDAGKSLLLLQLAATVATGGGAWPPRWSGPEDEQRGTRVHAHAPEGEEGGRTLWVTWEDERPEVRRRMGYAAAAAPPGLPHVNGIPSEALKDAARNRIDILDMRREGGPLWAPVREGSRHTSTEGELTPAGRSVLASLPGYSLCAIDPVAAAFACNENDRSLVRAFVAALDRAAEESGCAVVLAGHPPKSASKYAGSTDWRNACRSMLVLGNVSTGWKRSDDKTPDGREKAEKKTAPIHAPRLECAKSNYAERTAIWLVRHYSAPSKETETELAWFAADEVEAARAAVRESVRRADPHGDMEPEIKWIGHGDEAD